MPNNYVPAQAEPLPERPKGPQRSSEVFAQWLQNAGGGIGAAVAFAVCWYVVWGFARWLHIVDSAWPDHAQVWVCALLAGAFVFGALMLIRSAVDEIVTVQDWNELVGENEQMRADNDALVEKVRNYQEQTRELQAEVRMLRTAKPKPTQVDEATWYEPVNNYVAPVREEQALQDIDPQVKRDAIVLIDLAVRGQKWGRDAMDESHGWKKTQWQAAKDLLVKAKVVTYDRSGRVPTLVSEDRTRCLELLEGVRMDSVRAGSAYSELVGQSDSE